MTYHPLYFRTQELVPQKVYEVRGELALELLDDRALITLDKLRKRYGSITVNDWMWGGNSQWRGLRTPDSPWYKPYSQHTFGRAFDCVFKEVTAEEVRQDIFKHPHVLDFEHIRSIELNTSWLHFDVRNCNRIKTYKP